jgi:hypothetical protein
MVPFEYCNRKNHIDISKNEADFIKEEKLRFAQVAILFMEKLNAITDDVRSLCEPFNLNSLGKVHRFIYNGEKIYKFEFLATSGEAKFNVFFKLPNLTSVDLAGRFVRSSKYGNQSSCVDQDQYKEFCFCKKKN